MTKKEKQISISLAIFIIIILSLGGYAYLSQQPVGERDYLGTLLMISTVPIIGLLVYFKIHRNDQSFPVVLRNIGWIVFVLWILSLAYRVGF